MSGRTIALGVGLFILGVSSMQLRAQTPEAHAQLLPQECVGVVLYADGETPVQSFPIRLWSTDKKRFVYRTRTDEEGKFRVPRLATGRSNLLVGSIKIDLEVMSEIEGASVQQHDVIVALPRRALVSGNLILYEVLVAPLLFQQPSESPSIVSP